MKNIIQTAQVQAPRGLEAVSEMVGDVQMKTWLVNAWATWCAVRFKSVNCPWYKIQSVEHW